MIKLGIIYGGISTEHDVSIMSAKSILENLNKEKYEIHEIYINEYGKWFEIQNGEKEEIYNLIWTLKELDVVFPILHGIGGEDGTIQGMLEMLKVPYVGCGVLASAVGMDKVYSKIIFKEVGIQQAKYLVIYYKNDKYYIRENGIGEELKFEKIIEKLKFPMFVKPSNSGSSVGVKKANDVNELKLAIENASKYDRKIIIEEGIKGKEVECAILEKKDEIIASTVGEIKSAEEFYSFDAKYNIPNSQTIIPAKIEKNLIEEISVAQKISNGSAFKKTINLTKQDDNISVYTKKSKKSSYPSRFQGVQATQLYNFYGVYADSDKLKVYNESINTQLRLSLSKSEFDYYNDLIKSANNNDEFQIEFYTDKDGKNLGYIESIQLVEKKNSPSYSENISVKENSDLYTVTKSDNSELENICWLIVKDGEIQKIVDASEINEFKLRKDVPEGVYTVLLCTDYDSTTHSYTQVSNAIEIII